MKCLEKDRARRYDTANGLAMDVQRYLNNEPVVARPPSKLYRFEKMVQRNRAAVASAVALGLSLVLGLGFSISAGIQQKRARKQAEAAELAALREAERNRQVVDLVYCINGTIFQRTTGAARQQLADLFDQATEILDRGEVKGQPGIEAHLRVLFGRGYDFLGAADRSEAMYHKVLELEPQLASTNDDVVTALQLIGRRLFIRGDWAGAEKQFREALRIDKVAGLNSNAEAAHLFLGRMLSRQGKLDLQGGDNLRAGGAVYVTRGECYGDLLYLLHRQGKQAEAARLLKDVSSVLTKPEYTDMLESAGRLCARHGLWQAAAACFSRLIELEPTNPALALIPTSNWNWCYVAELLAQAGDSEGYEKHRHALLARFGSTDRPYIAERTVKASSLLPLAAGDLEIVGKLAETAVSLGAEDGSLPWYELAKGLAEYRQGRFAAASEWMQKVLSAKEFGNRDAGALIVLAMAQHRLGQTQRALSTLAEGCDLLDKKGPALDSGDIGPDWRDRIMDQVLRTEAERLLEVGLPERAAKLKAYLAEATPRRRRLQLQQYRRAAEAGQPRALNNLAWFLATCLEKELRDGPAAVRLAEVAVKATDRKDPGPLDTLAAAYAETGQFAMAISTEREAIAIVRDSEQETDYTSRLSLYESNSPYRAPD
jgi:tetratricopeptide (TPR) repeat protein